MSRSERSKKILFEPGRYRMDPAVLAMSDAARGMYSMLFCAACETHEPGVIEPATPEVLCVLAATTPENWLQHCDEVARAFDTTVQGRWVQKGLIETFGEQDRFVQRQRERGQKSAAKRKARRRVNQVSTSTPEPAATSEHIPAATLGGSRFSVPKDLESKDQTKTSFGVGTVSGAEPGAAVNGDPTPNPTPVGPFSLSRFEPQNQTVSDPEAVHRLVAAGVDSLLADQLVAKEAEARRRIGGGA